MSVFLYEDTKMYYEEIGDGVPFLLIHGWAIDHRFLKNCLEEIFTKSSKSFRRIYVDVPGMGQSIASNVRNGDDITKILIAFMEEIAPGESFYVGGNSFGSVVARAMTAMLGDKVLGIMLIAPALDRRHTVTEAKELIIDKNFASRLDEKELEDFSYMQANINQETYDRYKELVKPSFDINANNPNLRGKLKGTFSFDINKMIAKSSFKGPVLILTGKNDRAVGYKKQYEWLELFENASFFVLNNAGHNIHVDQPRAFNMIIGSFLEELG